MSGASTAGRVVMITGAAGGLGQGLVAEFAAQGWRVAATYHRNTSQPETGTIWPARLDVTDRANALGRINTIAEVARFIVFLAMMENVSGQLFQLDSRRAPWT